MCWLSMSVLSQISFFLWSRLLWNCQEFHWNKTKIWFWKFWVIKNYAETHTRKTNKQTTKNDKHLHCRKILWRKKDLDVSHLSNFFTASKFYTIYTNFFNLIQQKNRFNNTCFVGLQRGFTVICINPLAWHLAHNESYRNLLLLIFVWSSCCELMIRNYIFHLNLFP